MSTLDSLMLCALKWSSSTVADDTRVGELLSLRSSLKVPEEPEVGEGRSLRSVSGVPEEAVVGEGLFFSWAATRERRPCSVKGTPRW